MKNSLISQANQVIKNVNFTNLVEAKNGTKNLGIICANGNGTSLWFSYTNPNFYASIGNKIFKLV